MPPPETPANATPAQPHGLPADLLLRRLTADDLAPYKALRDLLLREYPQAFTSDAETESRHPAENYRGRIGTPPLDDGRFTLGAWCTSPAAGGGKRRTTLLGAISCERDARPKVAHIGHIVGMMVDPPAQGRGIGRALLAGCIEAARRAGGIELLTLSVTTDNAAAVALYRRAGFTRYGTLSRAIRIGGDHHSKDLMVLDLRATDAC